MEIINNNPVGWRGAPSAKLVKLPQRKRVVREGKRLSVTYAVFVSILGQDYLFPADRNGNTIRCKAIKV